MKVYIVSTDYIPDEAFDTFEKANRRFDEIIDHYKGISDEMDFDSDFELKPNEKRAVNVLCDDDEHFVDDYIQLLELEVK